MGRHNKRIARMTGYPKPAAMHLEQWWTYCYSVWPETRPVVDKARAAFLGLA